LPSTISLKWASTIAEIRTYSPAPAVGQPGGPILNSPGALSWAFGKAAEKLDEFDQSDWGRMLQGLPDERQILGGVSGTFGVLSRLGKVEKVAEEFDGLADLAKFRAGLGLKAGEGTLARLEVDGKAFYGINAHGQPITMGVNAISRTHAEADAFQQALNAGVKGGNATLYVDRALCAACGQNGGVRSMARQLGLSQVTVITPQGTLVVRP
jgi:hypothetical protein